MQAPWNAHVVWGSSCRFLFLFLFLLCFFFSFSFFLGWSNFVFLFFLSMGLDVEKGDGMRWGVCLCYSFYHEAVDG